MSRPIEQALLSLIPTQNSDLPPPLVELASSLLAQSRHRASTLKAEEEIARLYACAHIACDRLKITLNLPPINPRPPIPPRIYKRLYTHLDKILPASLPGRPKANGLSTPRSEGLRSPASRPLPSRVTPTKEVSLAQFRTPSKPGRPSKLNLQSTAKKQDSVLPLWLRPTVRHLCSTLACDNGADLAPTVIFGLETIIAPHRRRTEDEWVNGHLTVLVGAIYWYVSESARLAPGEEMIAETSRTRYKGMRKEMLVSLRSARDKVEISATRGKKGEITKEDEAAWWDGWQETTRAADLDEAITEVTKRDWLNSDWYRSIEFLQHHAEGEEDEEDERDNNGEDTTTTAATVQVRKADTMLQDKFDYLSERRRAEFRQWKAGILRRIDLLERGQAGDSMGVHS